MIRTDQIRINYKLTFKAPFLFGIGLRKGLIHRTASRDAKGYLYVPGSTIKGVLRERCEHLARLFNLKIRAPHGERSALAEFNPNASLVDRIFGSRFRPGRLYFDDASMSQEDQALFDGEQEPKRYLDKQIQQRTQVSISRLTHTARPEFLYTSEFGLHYLHFEGQIYGWLQDFSLPDDSRGTYASLLLLAGLCSLDRLGGNKSTGAGQFTWEILKLQINGEMQQRDTWLEKLVDLEYYEIAQGLEQGES